MYEVTITMQIKTFGEKMTHCQMSNIIQNCLGNEPKFRDVLIVEYKGDTLPDAINLPFGDIDFEAIKKEINSHD